VFKINEEAARYAESAEAIVKRKPVSATRTVAAPARPKLNAMKKPALVTSAGASAGSSATDNWKEF